MISMIITRLHDKRHLCVVRVYMLVSFLPARKALMLVLCM